MYRILKLCHRPFQASKSSRFEQKFFRATEPSEPLRGFKTRKYTHTQLQKIFFSLTLVEKKKITRKNMPIILYFECFRFYHQLRFLFHDSRAEHDGSPHTHTSLACPTEPGSFRKGFYAKMPQCLPGRHRHKCCCLLGHMVWYFRVLAVL